MTKFLVRGADSTTGTDVSVAIDAADERHAAKIAKAKGVFVSSIEPATPPVADYAATAEPGPGKFERLRGAFNSMIQGRPAALQPPADLEDVYRAIRALKQPAGHGSVLVIALLLTAILITLLAAPGWREPRFEYKITAYSDATIERDLSSDGAIGWQVVGSRRASGSKAYEDPSYELILMRRR